MQYRGRNVISAKPMSMASDTYMITYEDGSVGVAHKNALFGDQNTEAIKKVVDEIRPVALENIDVADGVPISEEDMKYISLGIDPQNLSDSQKEYFKQAYKDK